MEGDPVLTERPTATWQVSQGSRPISIQGETPGDKSSVHFAGESLRKNKADSTELGNEDAAGLPQTERILPQNWERDTEEFKKTHQMSTC